MGQQQQHVSRSAGVSFAAGGGDDSTMEDGDYIGRGGGEEADSETSSSRRLQLKHFIPEEDSVVSSLCSLSAMSTTTDGDEGGERDAGSSVHSTMPTAVNKLDQHHHHHNNNNSNSSKQQTSRHTDDDLDEQALVHNRHNTPSGASSNRKGGGAKGNRGTLKHSHTFDGNLTTENGASASVNKPKRAGFLKRLIRSNSHNSSLGKASSKDTNLTDRSTDSISEFYSSNKSNSLTRRAPAVNDTTD